MSGCQPAMCLFSLCSQNLANDAAEIWKKMTDLKDQDIRLPHDGYVKLWQLSCPSLAKYEVLLIDEAQDLTPGWYYMLNFCSAASYFNQIFWDLSTAVDVKKFFLRRFDYFYP